ncbi:MAG TPA: hypothetical protein VHN37_10460 [Actinomycetota bacterium]|nr:hypothetical protein [Actinomycetota bacterium]
MRTLFEGPERLTRDDAIKTYRYLRIGMVGAVFFLAAAVAIEHDKVGCWQTSISAYYYTPARAIFVGALIAIGLALIVIKGRTSFEDVCLNIAGMLAPVVAIVPITGVGKCWSIPPNPLPIQNGKLADWVIANVENNFDALLLAGAFGLAIAAVVALFVNRGVRGTIQTVDTGTLVSLAFTAAALAFGWWLIETWSGFYKQVHGLAALFMFVFLTGAVIAKALSNRDGESRTYFVLYAVLAFLMPVGGIAITVLGIGGDHETFVVEAYEIVLFAVFWLIQTWENWDEGSPAPAASEPALLGRSPA